MGISVRVTCQKGENELISCSGRRFNRIPRSQSASDACKLPRVTGQRKSLFDKRSERAAITAVIVVFKERKKKCI